MKKSVLLCAMLMVAVCGYAQISTSVNAASGFAPIHWAAAQGYIEMIKVLSSKGYDVNAKDEAGFTPLHYAALSGQFETVQYLADNGADIYAVNAQNYTPLTLAAQAGDQKVVDYLFVKMRSIRIDQLKAQIDKDRVETDLSQAAKARAEAERLRAKAEEWTTEARRWRDEAEKWNKEAQKWKAQQIILEQAAQDRLSEAMAARQSSEEKYQTERSARLAAERVVTEISASEKAQRQALEAAQAALNAQRATDAAINNLADEFIKQGKQAAARLQPSISPDQVGDSTAQDATEIVQDVSDAFYDQTGDEMPPTNELVVPEDVFQDPNDFLDPQYPVYNDDVNPIVEEIM